MSLVNLFNDTKITGIHDSRRTEHTWRHISRQHSNWWWLNWRFIIISILDGSLVGFGWSVGNKEFRDCRNIYQYGCIIQIIIVSTNIKMVASLRLSKLNETVSENGGQSPDEEGSISEINLIARFEGMML